MNETEIRALAERAATLEDRTGDRIAEIHDRIGAARRRRRTTVVAGCAAVLVVAAVSVAAVTSARDDTAPQPAPPPDTSVNIGSVPGPDRGTCWVVPLESVIEQDYWYDDSPQVPCTEEHTTETVSFYELDEPTPDAAEEYLDRCSQAVGAYLGIDFSGWVPWGFIIVLPSEEQVDDGASWARCDAVFPARWNFGAARETTGSAVGVADNPPDEFWACLNKAPAVDDQPLVPCDQPHAYQATGTLAYIVAPQTYPSQAQLDQAMRTHCERAIPAALSGVSVSVAWTPRDQWQPYDDVADPCFMHDPDGQPLPPR